MIFYLLFFYLLSESTATNCTNNSASTSYDMSNKIICYYLGDCATVDPSLDNLDAKSIPSECDLILYGSFQIDQSSMIEVDEKHLKSVTDLKKPVIVTLQRAESYSGWSAILSENGYANDTKVLCDFAKKNSIQGYDIFYMDPGHDEAVDKNVGKNIIPYINQLKELCPFLIIGATISVIPKKLNNKDIYNYEELNNVLTFYNIDVAGLNNCNPMLYNGLTPITKSEPGKNYLYGMEEVVLNLKKTKICFEKLVFVIPVFTINNANDSYPAYTKMCEGKIDNSTWCVQTSQNYYDKGKYLHELKVGIRVSGLDWDDYDNTCKCQSAFNGFYNLRAGYIDGTVLPCSKFDVQSTIYPIK